MPAITNATLRTFAADPALYRQHVVGDVDGRAVLLHEVMEQRQADDFAAADPGWRQAIGLPPAGEAKRLWSTRPRGASKTTDAAVMLVWALAFAPDRQRGLAAAGDFDQAKILAQAVQRLLDLNPWLATEVIDRDTGRRSPMLVCQSNRIRNAKTGAETIILSADAPSAFGHLADWLVLDEICNWAAAGEALWTTLASTIAKRRRAMVEIRTNAGWLESWQRRVYDSLGATWHRSHWDSPAAWMPEELLAEQRALLSPEQFARLYEDKWSSGFGDAIPDADIDASVTLPGPPEPFSVVTNAPRGTLADRRPHYIGIDIGVKKDHAAAVCLAADSKNHRVQLRHCQTWRPRGNLGVDLQQVRADIIGIARRFNAVAFYDPHQAQLMAQDIRAAGVQCIEVPFTGPALNEMAAKLLQAFTQRRIDLWNDEELIAGLRRLSIVERPNFGVRLVATRDANVGHCDSAIALSIVLPRALDEALDPMSDPEVSAAVGRMLWDQKNYARRSPRVY